MTIEELKQRLEGIRWIDKELDSLYLELQYIETGLLKHTVMTQTKVQVSKVNASENQLVAKITLKENLRDRIDRLTTERVKIISLLDQLKNHRHRVVLNLFYIQHKHILDVCEIMEVEKSTIYRNIKTALQELADLLTQAETEVN